MAYRGIITQRLTLYVPMFVQFLVEQDSVLKAPPIAVSLAEVALMCAGILVGSTLIGINLQSLAEYVLIQFAYFLTACRLTAALIIHHLAIAILDVTNVHFREHLTGLTILSVGARLHAQQVVWL